MRLFLAALTVVLGLTPSEAPAQGAAWGPASEVLPDPGVVTIENPGDGLPLLTQMVMLNVLHSAGREVVILAGGHSSRLVGPPGSEVWVHLPRPKLP